MGYTGIMSRPRTRPPLIPGHIFGLLIVKEAHDGRVSCLCRCGRLKDIREDHLVAGTIISCGCYRKDRAITQAARRASEAGPPVGTRFGQLTVMSVSRDGVACDCDCGRSTILRRTHLISGASRTCGCGRLTQDGLSRTKEYTAWSGMLGRCHNPSERSFRNYGARGIHVCPEWHPPDGFTKFVDHIGKMPSPGLTVDRIDNAKGYEPGNVRWATRKEQARNQRRNRLITAFGKTQCLQAWEDETGIKRNAIVLRLDAGWSPEEAVSLPKNSRRAACR